MRLIRLRIPRTTGQAAYHPWALLVRQSQRSDISERLAIRQVVPRARRLILAMMLTYGADFKLTDLQRSSSLPTLLMHPIAVVNIKTFQGPSEYIGRPMPGRTGSPLGNPFKIKPWGPYERNESVMVHYRAWLWKEMQKRSGDVYRELIRLALIAKTGPLNLACWCAPETCHGEIVKNAINYLIQQRVAA